MRIELSWICAVVLLAGLAHAAEPDAVQPLREAINPKLQAGLEQTLVEIGLKQATGRKQLAVALAGITNLECPHFAHVNGDKMMYAASLPKIAILLAALRRDQDGELALTPKDMASLRKMIRKSSNSDATRMLDRVGRDYVNDLLQSEEYRLYDPGHNGGLWVGKPYSSEGAFERDPLHHLSHGATAIQVARFFYLLETGQLLDEAHSQSMKRILADPGIVHKFVAGLRGVRPRAQLYRKSGTWRDYHTDAVLVERRDGRRYVAVGMAHHPKGEAWLRKLIVALDSLIDRTPPPCAAE